MSVRGYAEWNPKPEALHWVRATGQVLDEYRDYWPLSVRQLFYRLVADHGYAKSEAAYNKLTGYISRARRAGLLPWAAVRDGGLGRTLGASYFDGADNFMDSIRSAARGMRLDRQRDQEAVVELWCEAGGMVPILSGIGRPYSCQVNTGGGYDSVTAKHNLAVRVRDRATEDRKTIILHVGDFDGSGEDMCNVLREDAQHMVASQVLRAAKDPASCGEWVPEDVFDTLNGGGPTDEETQQRAIRWALDYFTVERVALTGQQVIDRRVETAPPKPTDSRSARFVERNRWVADELGTSQITAQLEALTPPELEELIKGAIEEHLDMDAYGAILAEEEDVREDVLERLG
jgi:hypothetical protein